MGFEVGEKFIRIEKKTNKERILVMSSKLREVLDKVIEVLHPNPTHFIFSSQKGKGMKPMCVQTFNGYLKEIMKEYKIKYIGNCSSYLLRKTFVVISNLTPTVRLSLNYFSYTNFETNQMLNLYELG